MKWSFIDDYEVKNVSGYDLSNLSMDQYYLNIDVKDHDQIYLYTLRKECYECPYVVTEHCTGSLYCDRPLTKNIFATDVTFRLATEYKKYYPQHQTENKICDIGEEFGEFGIYNVLVNRSGCFVDIVKEPVNIYTPSLTVIFIYLALFLLIYGLYKVWKRYFVNSSKNKQEATQVDNVKERVVSLDVYRGLTIVVMIFANYGQGGYTVIEHARWNGLHVADLVFPSFLWIMGACIPISTASSFKKKVPNKTMIANISKRSLKLFCLGIFLNGGSDLDYIRIFGVLQRLGVGYFVAALVYIYVTNREVGKDDVRECWLKYITDILTIYKGWLIVLVMLIIHTILIFVVAAPGCQRGYMGPGGLHKNRSFVNCIGGATGYIDGLILGNHRYQHPTIYETYESAPFDPEGLVGCLTTIFQTFIGVQAGTTLLVYKSHAQRLKRWLLWAVFTGIAGGALCGFSKEDGLIPVNKNLWSLSFVLVTSCFAFSTLSLLYVLVDLKKWWLGKPFIFPGQNAILLYIGHEMSDGHFPIRWYIHNYSSVSEDPRRTHFLALLSDTWATSIWVIISYYLYKIKYFFTV